MAGTFTKRKGTQRTPKKHNRRRKPGWQRVFILSLRSGMTVTESARTAGVGRTTVYDERERSERFRELWDRVEDQATEALEREAYRRANEGVSTPVFQGGEKVGHVQKYSDTLTIFLLKARRPEKYRENVSVQHSGHGGGPVVIHTESDEERRQAVAGILNDAHALEETNGHHAHTPAV